MTVEEAKARVKQCEEALRVARDELRAATIEHSPIKIGEIYERTVTRGHGARAKKLVQRGKVTGFSTSYYGETRPRITLFVASGNLGLREVDVYAWDQWTKLEAE